MTTATQPTAVAEHTGKRLFPLDVLRGVFPCGFYFAGESPSKSQPNRNFNLARSV
jgi:hypothetical protein